MKYFKFLWGYITGTRYVKMCPKEKSVTFIGKFEYEEIEMVLNTARKCDEHKSNRP